MSTYMHKKKGPSFSSTVLLFTIIFLFIPLFVVTFFSLNSSKGMQWEGASLIWYKKLIFDSPSLWTAFRNSLIIALSSSATAVVLGSLAAVGIKWYRLKGKSYIITVSYLPMVLPEVIIGISMLIFFSAVKIRLGMFTIYVAHTTFNLPFVFMLEIGRAHV